MTEAPQPVTGSESMPRRELVIRTNKVLEDYGRLSLEGIRPMVRAGEAKQVVTFVRNRPGEAQHLIDSVGEPLLAHLIRENSLHARIIGENNDNFPLGSSADVQVVFPIDPFDNTSPYVRGLDTPPYSVVGAFDNDGKPIGGVIVDIKGNQIYTAVNGRVNIKDVETGITKGLGRSRRTNISDEQVTIASFVGEKEYSVPFFEKFSSMIEAMHPKGLLYPGGGAFIYALLASGAVDAYVMPDEPRSEIDPGIPMLLLAGGKADSIDPETGRATPYRFDPNKTSADSVPLFIAYSMPEIRDQIVERYMQNKSKLVEQREALRYYRQMQEGQTLHIPQA